MPRADILKPVLIRNASEKLRNTWPQLLSQQISRIPASIVRPPGQSRPEIGVMRQAGRYAAQILQSLSLAALRPGISTLELDNMAFKQCIELGCYPASLGIEGYPHAICTSVNDVVCHGVPSSEVFLQDGDVVKLDLAVFYQGAHADSANTIIVGGGSSNSRYKNLVDAARLATSEGCSACLPGVTLSTIAKIVEKVAEKNNVAVIPAIHGHLIGRFLHEDPKIPFCMRASGKRSAGRFQLKPGMFLTIEPALTFGDSAVSLEDFAVKTLNGQVAAQFEHTVAISENGAEILTKI